MKRHMKILAGAVALMAGVSLASAQGMRDVPGASDRGVSSGASRQKAPDASQRGKEVKSPTARVKSETRGEAPKARAQVQGERQLDRGQAPKARAQVQGERQLDRGQAKSDRGKRSTVGQAAPEKKELRRSRSAQSSKVGEKRELKSKSSRKSGEKATTGQAIKETIGPARKGESGTATQTSKGKNERSTTGQGSPDSKAQSQQNKTTGTATQSKSSTQQSGASIRSRAGVQVSAQQQTTIQRSVLSARNVPRVDRVSFSIRTGTVVPRSVRVVSVTTFPILIEVFPRYRNYSFFVVEDEIIFVDRGYRIVDIVPVGGSTRVSSTTSTTFVEDLSEDEIREIQLVLIERGFLHGRADGVFGRTTRVALIAFQRRQGFAATGRIDVRTVSALGLSGKVRIKSEGQAGSTPSRPAGPPSTTGQGQREPQQSGEKARGQAPSSPQQDNARGHSGAQKPSDQKGSNAQPAPRDQRSTNGQSAPKSTTGQGSSERPGNKQPGMSDQKGRSGSSSSGQGHKQPPGSGGQSDEKPLR